MLHPKAKRQIRRTICIAAAVTLALGAAFAATNASGILDRLFSHGQPSRRALEAVVRDAAQVSQAGVTVHMDEYLFDQNTLHLGWTVSTQRDTPVYYTTDYTLTYENPADAALAEDSVGGSLGATSSGEVGDNVLQRLSEAQSAHSGYVDLAYGAPVEGIVHAKLCIRAYETDCEAVDLPTSDVWDLAEDTALTADLEDKGQIGVTQAHQTRIDGYAAFNEALARLMEDGVDFDSASEAALVECGFFREVAALELDIEVDPALAAAPRFSLDGERSFELAGAQITLEALTIDTASTCIEYRIEATQDPDAFLNGLGLVLLDQRGEPLNADCALSMSAQPVEDNLWRVTISGNPIPEDVTALTFVKPTALARENESSNDHYRRMVAATDPAQRFTVELN